MYVYTYVFLNIIPQTLHSCHNRLQRCLLSPLVVHYDESAAKHNQRANLSVEESTKEQRRRNDGNSDLCMRACVRAGRRSDLHRQDASQQTGTSSKTAERAATTGERETRGAELCVSPSVCQSSVIIPPLLLPPQAPLFRSERTRGGPILSSSLCVLCKKKRNEKETQKKKNTLKVASVVDPNCNFQLLHNSLLQAVLSLSLSLFSAMHEK